MHAWRLQVGMALEAGGLRDQMVTAAADGELKLIDFRMLGEGATAGALLLACCWASCIFLLAG